MKNNKLIIALFGIASLLSCSDDDMIQDPVHEFISFENESITVNENAGDTEPAPITLHLLGYEPGEDITVNLSVSNNNVEEGVDYTLSSGSVRFKKGNFISDTLFVSTIDNETGAGFERSFDINIESISKPEIKIGLGIENPANATLNVVIIDDECTETTGVFHSATLNNQNHRGTTTISSDLDGDVLTLTGDLIVYSAFSNASLALTLTPDSEGATKGTVTFDTSDAGTDSDGYIYQLRQVDEGTYDVCSGEIIVSFDVYYKEEGESWIFWYTSNNKIRI